MATEDQVSLVHQNISFLSGFGAGSCYLGLASYFMAYEYRDFDRVDLRGKMRMERRYRDRSRWSKIAMTLSVLLFVGGLVLLVLGMSLYPFEKEQQAFEIPSLIQQIRNQEAEPSVNEPAILAGIASAVVLLGAYAGAREFSHTETFGWVATVLYAAGWLANGFAASMNGTSITNLDTMRIAWTIPGAVAIAAGTFMFPWQLNHNYVSGPAWPVAGIGFACFAIGSALVTDAPAYNGPTVQ